MENKSADFMMAGPAERKEHSARFYHEIVRPCSMAAIAGMHFDRKRISRFVQACVGEFFSERPPAAITTHTARLSNCSRLPMMQTH
jgi:hypothetical protein